MLEHIEAAENVTLGFLPTHRGVFDKEPALRNRKLIQNRLDELGLDYVDILEVTEDGLLDDPADAEAVARHFEDNGVDAVFIAHCSFGEETAVAEVCKRLDLPVLLWGIRDSAPSEDGTRHGDVQCGLFAMGKVLRRHNIRFTYLTNSEPDSSVFTTGVDVFMRAANIASTVRGARIGQVSTRPGPFASVMCNEGELRERFGIQLIPVALSTVTEEARHLLDSDRLEDECEEVHEQIDVRIEEEELQKIVALRLALQNWADREKLDAVALQCWRALEQDFGICPCFAHGQLADMGLPVACETDVHGAISALVARAATMGRDPIFFADLTVRHPDNENGELLWHCGPFPPSLAVEVETPRLTPHFGMGVGGAGEWRIRGGDITLVRFDGDHGDYHLLMGHARGTDGPETVGNYLWAEFDNWPRWEERLVCGPYIHHVIGVHGQYAPAVLEACQYLDLQPDAVEPDEASMREFLRSGKGDLLSTPTNEQSTTRQVEKPPTEDKSPETDEPQDQEAEKKSRERDDLPDKEAEEESRESHSATADEETGSTPSLHPQEEPTVDTSKRDAAPENEEPTVKSPDSVPDTTPEKQTTPPAPSAVQEKEQPETASQSDQETLWYVAHGGKQYGPYSENQMWKLIEDGRVMAKTRLWNKRMDKWCAADDVLPFAIEWS
ncbi:MAG: GYF domain-containing protein [Planctomycetota bacterium]